MITLTGPLRIFVCTQPTDMRRSFDGLCGMAADLMRQDPLSGHLFVFRNRNRDRLKLLWWDRDGLAMFYKRLERGTWQLPTDVRPLRPSDDGVPSVEITAEELTLLLGGIDLRSVQKRQRYQRPQTTR